MKMSKIQFKTLMKECLTELINEGAFDKKLEKIAESKMPSHGTGILYGNQAASPSRGGQATYSPPQEQAGVNPRLLEAVKNVISKQPPGRKSLFEEILMDTALTTLQKQIGSGDGFGAAGALFNDAPVSQEIIAHDQAQLQAMSGGDPSRWAMAAFGNKKR